MPSMEESLSTPHLTSILRTLATTPAAVLARLDQKLIDDAVTNLQRAVSLPTPTMPVLTLTATELVRSFKYGDCVLFTKRNHPSSDEACALIARYTSDYTVVDVDARDDSSAVEEAVASATGGAGLPQVFCGGSVLGGSAELRERVADGSLAKRLKASGCRLLAQDGGEEESAQPRRSSGARVVFAEEPILVAAPSPASATLLPTTLEAKLKTFFSKMDTNADGKIVKEEAVQYWGKNFAKVNANSMFNEVDQDKNSEVTWEEFLGFWKNVAASGYDLSEIDEEVDMMLEGGSWVDFDDGRHT